VATVVFAAAGKTGDYAPHAADALKLLTTIRTTIDEPSGVSSRGKRKIVTALFVGHSQVHTSLLPLGAMWRNPPSTSTKLGENMRQLMPQGAIDFGRIFK
jgi:hypothetical protein